MAEHTPRASSAINNMVRMRAMVASLKQLDASNQSQEYGIAIPERTHLISTLERYIKRCEEIIIEEENRI